MTLSRIFFILVVVVCLTAVFLATRSTPRSTETAVKIGTPQGEKVVKTDAAWQKELTPEAYEVTRLKGTERAFSGTCWNTKGDGTYRCICCDQILFDSKTKFDSGTGWPSFWQPIDDNAVSLFADSNGFMSRTEVVCSRCDAHLGHVFNDGPKPTGQRYCMNSVSLKFERRIEK